MTANGGFLVTGRPDHFALPHSVIGFEYTDVIESQLKPLLQRLDGQRVGENEETSTVTGFGLDTWNRTSVAPTRAGDRALRSIGRSSAQ